jgi:hypothetical protein
MRTTIRTSTRDEFIALGQFLGETLVKNPQEKPWAIGIDGQLNTGKSLLVLGIDSAFNPDLYPNGISKDAVADNISYYSQKAKVSFLNAWMHAQTTAPGDIVANCLNKHGNAKVLILSNLHRGQLSRDFETAMHEHKIPAALDMHIHVDADPESHDRITSFTTGHSTLIHALFKLESIAPQHNFIAVNPLILQGLGL